jgi:hypothetical protein
MNEKEKGKQWERGMKKLQIFSLPSPIRNVIISPSHLTQCSFFEVVGIGPPGRVYRSGRIFFDLSDS